MTTQLLLVDRPPAWHLDTAARERGLRGIADAREVLRSIDARQRLENGPEDTDGDSPSPLADAA